MNRAALLLSATVYALTVACGDTGREHITIPLSARGTEARDVRVEGGTLRLREARVAFGPLYLCATESAETELCETALAEWLDADTFDALSDDAQPLGELDATTGAVRSGFFDYGITWLLTGQGPRASEGAERGHSATLVFDLTPDDGDAIEVRAAVDVEPLGPGDAAVNALETRRDLRDGSALSIVVDPNAWLRRVRIADVLALDDDADGRVTLREGAQAYEAILQGMTVNDTPTLEWR